MDNNELKRKMEEHPLGRMLNAMDEMADTPEAQQQFLDFLRDLARHTADIMPDGAEKDSMLLFCEADALSVDLHKLIRVETPDGFNRDGALAPGQVAAIRDAIQTCHAVIRENAAYLEED